VKLATELYDSDDAAPSRTPPLVRREVKLQPSPSPEYPTPPPRSPSPEPSNTAKRRGRRRRTQPSQSDGVLISVLGGLNNPDIANRAAESPLNSASQSEIEDSDVAMEEVEEGGAVAGRNLLAQVAQDAIQVGGHEEAQSRSCSPRPDSVRRVRPPKLQTRALDAQLRRPGPSGLATVKEKGNNAQRRSSPQNLPANVPHPGTFEKKPPHTNSHSSAQGDSPLGRNGSYSTMFSPALRKHTIALSEGSPMETLPAIQQSPNLSSGKSPSNQPSLPSLQHLALPLDARSPKDNDLRSLGMSQRHTFPMQSPSTGPLTSRATFPSPQTRMNGHFQPYPSAQPSPASTYSETSPRDAYRLSVDATSMSPPGKPERHFYSSGRTPQTDELTPASSESYKSTAGSLDTPLSTENLSADGPRPILPPLVSGPYVGGVFQCDFPGCTAVPFQTQYLLKWVSSSDFRVNDYI